MRRNKTIPFRSKARPKVKPAEAEPDFNSVPIPTMCQSIQMLIDNMASRGFPVYDFDNKDKTVKQVGMIGNKVYFLATKEGDNGEEA